MNKRLKAFFRRSGVAKFTAERVTVASKAADSYMRKDPAAAKSELLTELLRLQKRMARDLGSIDHAIWLARTASAPELDGLITLREMRVIHVSRVLEAVKGNKTAAAKILGCSPRTVYEIAQELDGKKVPSKICFGHSEEAKKKRRLRQVDIK
jgi:hypothetical protein